MYVSILIPTFNRRRFSELIVHNILAQTYPFIKEVIVADDGYADERLNLKLPYSVLYYKVPRMTIGEKRNFLMSKASGEYIAHFDTDDMYSRDYLSSSIFNLIKNGKGLSGSSDMLMMDTATKTTYKQRCINMNMLNEATMCYTKSYAETHKFSNNMSSEGISFCEIKEIVETPIEEIMICLAHDSNTVSKKQWVTNEYRSPIDMTWYKQHLEIISQSSI